MRIIAGRFKGRIIAAPKGSLTRPTTDRVREAMMCSLLSSLNFDLEESEVLDLFAGSGALGLELLSRGALHVTFVEKDRRAARVVQDNIDLLRLSRQEAKLVVTDAFVWAKRQKRTDYTPDHPYHIVLLDPPYALDPSLVLQLVETLIEARALVPGALILYEHGYAQPGLASLVNEQEHRSLRVVKTKRMGTVAYDILEVCFREADRLASNHR